MQGGGSLPGNRYAIALNLERDFRCGVMGPYADSPAHESGAALWKFCRGLLGRVYIAVHHRRQRPLDYDGFFRSNRSALSTSTRLPVQTGYSRDQLIPIVVSVN